MNTGHGAVSYRSDVDERVRGLGNLVRPMLLAVAVAVLGQFCIASVHLVRSVRANYDGIEQQLGSGPVLTVVNSNGQ